MTAEPTTPAADTAPTRLQFSLAHLTVLGCAPPEMIYLAARAGYDFVSVRSIFMGLPGESNYSLHDQPELLKATRRALAATGIGLHDIELARIGDGIDIRRYEPAFEIAAELGARAVLSSIWSERRDWAVERFAELCDMARPYGLTVDLEAVPIAAVRTLAEQVAVLRAVERPNAGLMVDTHHFHRARDRAGDLAAVPAAWFHFAQICDAQAEIPTDVAEMTRILREERLYLGEGGIDVAAILNELPPLVYSIELPHLARAREFGFAEHAARCLESARSYLAGRLAPRAVAAPGPATAPTAASIAG